MHFLKHPHTQILDSELECAHCLPDCGRLDYSTSEKEWPIDEEEVCKNNPDLLRYITGKRRVWATPFLR